MIKNACTYNIMVFYQKQYNDLCFNQIPVNISVENDERPFTGKHSFTFLLQHL